MKLAQRYWIAVRQIAPAFDGTNADAADILISEVERRGWRVAPEDHDLVIDPSGRRRYISCEAGLLEQLLQVYLLDCEERGR